MKKRGLLYWAGGAVTIMTALVLYIQLGGPRPAMIEEVHAGDAANQQHSNEGELPGLEDRIERMTYRLATATVEAERNPTSEVIVRGKIALQSQLAKAKARYKELTGYDWDQ